MVLVFAATGVENLATWEAGGLRNGRSGGVDRGRGNVVTTHLGIVGDMAISRKQCDRIILPARPRRVDRGHRIGCIELLFGLARPLADAP